MAFRDEYESERESGKDEIYDFYATAFGLSRVGGKIEIYYQKHNSLSSHFTRREKWVDKEKIY